MYYFGPRTHAQRVRSVYKRILRTIEAYYVHRVAVRYNAVIIRDKFDKNKGCHGIEQRHSLLADAEKQLFLHQHPLPPAKFAKSIGITGGVAYGRQLETVDWILDYWHPLEKARYPTYFARREERKKEYVQLWESGVLR